MVPILRGSNPISSIFRRFHTGCGFVEGSPNSIILIFDFSFFFFPLRYFVIMPFLPSLLACQILTTRWLALIRKECQMK